MNSKIIVATLCAIILAACGDKTTQETAADHVFANARVYTLDEARPWAEAVAVKGNKIVYVGDTAGVEALVGETTQRRDLGGQLLLPGFIDSHVHPIAGGAYATALSLDTFGSVDDWVRAIADYATEHEDDPVLFGYGFLATTFGPVGPTRQLIDAVVPDRPVLIMDEGFHAAWANTAALQALNITQDTPDPVPGFSYYKRDANGDATGYLLEGTAGMAMDMLDVITTEVVVQGVGIVLDIMNAYGVTAAYDAGVIGYEEIAASVLQRTEDSGDLTVRLVGSYRPRGPE
ncbi:MAG: amidohydrolase family protein, partial [Gammaproteobacteria bacterium]|nr:amidohydrolase family protein [Gammaproteobacteria bacterium]